MHLPIVYLSLALLIIPYLGFKSWRQDAKFCSQHGCKPAPAFKQSIWLFGLDATLQFFIFMKRRNFLEQTSLFFQRTGKTFSVKLSGTTRIWTIQPENVKTILQSTGHDFELGWVRLKAFRPYIGESVPSSNGVVWAHGRALLRPSFARAQISNLGLYDEHFQKLATLIPTDGSTVDLLKLFSRLTMNVSTEIMFGESVNVLQPVVSKDILDLEASFEKATVGSMARFNMGNLIWLHWDPEYLRAIKVIHNYAQKFVAKALQYRQTLMEAEKIDEILEPEEKYIFIKALAKDTGDRKVLQDQLVGVLAAGRNSTASLLSHVFYLLARHPRVEERLRTEIAQLDGLVPTYDQLKSMSYLKHVINETLRLYPSVPINERSATRDTILPVGGGPDGLSPIRIRKGQTVLYHTYAMHRSVDLWGPDAAEFKPERWEAWTGKSGWRFMPFGGGGRICPGQQLALTETSYFVTRLLQTFTRLENRDERPFQENLGVALTVTGGVLVALGTAGTQTG